MRALTLTFSRLIKFLPAFAGFSCLVTPAYGQTLADLDFLDGHWVAHDGENRIEEIWLPTAGGTKTAMFRWANSDETVVIELMIVRQEDDGVSLRFKHYDDDYAAWEQHGPNLFRLIQWSANRAVFEYENGGGRAFAYMIYERDGEKLVFTGTSGLEAEDSEGDLVLEFSQEGAH